METILDLHLSKGDLKRLREGALKWLDRNYPFPKANAAKLISPLDGGRFGSKLKEKFFLEKDISVNKKLVYLSKEDHSLPVSFWKKAVKHVLKFKKSQPIKTEPLIKETLYGFFYSAKESKKKKNFHLPYTVVKNIFLLKKEHKKDDDFSNLLGRILLAQSKHHLKMLSKVFPENKVFLKNILFLKKQKISSKEKAYFLVSNEDEFLFFYAKKN